MTIWQDRAGCEESSRGAREWIRHNVASSTSGPQGTEGNVIVHFG